LLPVIKNVTVQAGFHQCVMFTQSMFGCHII
jgi:hypothetical protein